MTKIPRPSETHTDRLAHRSSLDAYHLFAMTCTQHLGRNQSAIVKVRVHRKRDQKHSRPHGGGSINPSSENPLKNFMRQNYNNNNQRQGDDTKQQQQDMTLQQLDMQDETKVWTLGRGVTCNDKFLVRN